ncbi:Type IV secretory pathway, VirD2 components (relaxase) [Sphingopyxis sp. YR583]|uniref:relaxase/mobilization nuclease RlxS n=1 Tax=Sphingopyxis sp. YR583 TaxID=1881047 RepID=UPI0008A73069|nr:relaxase/mobilization nuclease RlxS [Sphingopyxis sp. YR583]SEH12580.1 Type IV secretory pathway, VirD2 components (relaxase) [Sphingopyxis sp. YR583]
MASDDAFEPRLGRMRARGKAPKARKFLHRILAAANLARGGAPGRRGGSDFTGSRTGRGSGAGRLLASRDRFAAFRQRRVIVKARIVRLAGKGFEAAKAHLRYVERDGTTRGGGRGSLYDRDGENIDARSWVAKAAGDRHQLRLIVSPEDGLEYDDLKPLTRRLMARVEEDLGTRLDWVAVDHFDTGHPHIHVIVRGKDEKGKDLVVARDYIAHGIRERACEIVDLHLGPRSDRAIEQRLRAEIEQERLTSIDRTFLREAAGDVLVSAEARGAFDAAIRTGRLRKLERLGLAVREGRLHWSLSPHLDATLRRMGERDDIIRTMQREYAGRAEAPAAADRSIYDPGTAGASRLIGRIASRGLSDEHGDRYYMIVDAIDGRSHYVDIGSGEDARSSPLGAIVSVTPAELAIRASDRTIAAIAAANSGRYSLDAHLRQDPSMSEEFAIGHVRRLEAMRRAMREPVREPDGSWVIGSDHLERAASYEAMRARQAPVRVEMLSPVAPEQLVTAHAATWLDREIASGSDLPCREAGFGAAVSAALASRRAWLVAEGLAVEGRGRFRFRTGMLERLRIREVETVAARLAQELDKPFAHARVGDRVDGRLIRSAELLSGRHALIERARDFTLVPWRPVLERHIGKPVAGMMRPDGISWRIGRERGPILS